MPSVGDKVQIVDSNHSWHGKPGQIIAQEGNMLRVKLDEADQVALFSVGQVEGTEVTTDNTPVEEVEEETQTEEV